MLSASLLRREAFRSRHSAKTQRFAMSNLFGCRDWMTLAQSRLIESPGACLKKFDDSATPPRINSSALSQRLCAESYAQEKPDIRGCRVRVIHAAPRGLRPSLGFRLTHPFCRRPTVTAFPLAVPEPERRRHGQPERLERHIRVPEAGCTGREHSRWLSSEHTPACTEHTSRPEPHSLALRCSTSGCSTYTNPVWAC